MDEDDEDGEEAENRMLARVQRQLEPAVVAANFYTASDERIRKQDVPEREQVRPVSRRWRVATVVGRFLGTRGVSSRLDLTHTHTRSEHRCGARGWATTRPPRRRTRGAWRRSGSSRWR